MVKTLNISLDNELYDEVIKIKKDMTWINFFKFVVDKSKEEKK